MERPDRGRVGDHAGRRAAVRGGGDGRRRASARGPAGATTAHSTGSTSGRSPTRSARSRWSGPTRPIRGRWRTCGRGSTARAWNCASRRRSGLRWPAGPASTAATGSCCAGATSRWTASGRSGSRARSARPTGGNRSTRTPSGCRSPARCSMTGPSRWPRPAPAWPRGLDGSRTRWTTRPGWPSTAAARRTAGGSSTANSTRIWSTVSSATARKMSPSTTASWRRSTSPSTRGTPITARKATASARRCRSTRAHGTGSTRRSGCTPRSSAWTRSRATGPARGRRSSAWSHRPSGWNVTTAPAG